MADHPLWRRAPTSAQTTIPCARCATPLRAERTCHTVTLTCPSCGRRADVAEYIAAMDEALETFMDALPCDRI